MSIVKLGKLKEVKIKSNKKAGFKYMISENGDTLVKLYKNGTHRICRCLNAGWGIPSYNVNIGGETRLTYARKLVYSAWVGTVQSGARIEELDGDFSHYTRLSIKKGF